VEGSDEIWLAALGPGIQPQGTRTTATPWWQHQVASTVAELLGHDFQAFQYKAQAALPLLQPEQQLANSATTATQAAAL
jgi:hypothetical protein